MELTPITTEPRRPHPGAGAGRLVSTLAQSAAEVQEAQRLRYLAFRDQLRSDAPAHVVGLDQDRWDPHCAHLLVRDATSSALIGTYRILDADAAAAAGGFYSAAEFDLDRVLALGGRLVEVGRACVHPDHRSGGVVATLLAALARHLYERRYDWVMGCASVGVGPDPAPAAALCRRVLTTNPSPDEWRVFPRVPFPCPPSPTTEDAPLPPLLKGYLRLGAVACGEPAWDSAFGTADLLLLLRLADMAPRWRARLTRERW